MNTACTAEGCERSAFSRGFCGMHYQRWRKHGNADVVLAGGEPGSFPWTDEDVEVIRKSANLTASAVAKSLGRTTQAVHRMRSEIGRDEGINFKRNYSLDPNHVGSRALIAKTCLGCGQLLPARWYCHFNPTTSRNKRRWSTHCVRCIGAKHKESGAVDRANSKRTEERMASSRSVAKKLNEITKERAARHRFPWLESDHNTLRDSSLTLFEKAIALGRTYCAVSAACSKNGYTSRVGHGDPTAGAWHIQNPNEMEQAS